MFLDLTQEWCVSGVPSFRASLTGLPIDEFGWPVTEMREGRAVTFGPDDIPEGADAARRVLARDNTRLFAVVPLVFAGEVIGSIGFQRIRSTRSLTEEQGFRLRLVGDMIAGAFARRGAQVSLLRSEQRFAQVVASALDGFAMTSEKGVVLEWTAQAERILGWPRGEMLGGSLGSILSQRDRATYVSVIDMHAAALKTPGKRLELAPGIATATRYRSSSRSPPSKPPNHEPLASSSATSPIANAPKWFASRRSTKSLV